LLRVYSIMQTEIETSRLVMRPFRSRDATAAFGWFGDPVVMRFVPSGPDTSVEQTRERIARYQEHQNTHGFSKWLILERQSGNAVGDSGLIEMQAYGWIDLGFRLAQPYWGKGFATEAAAAWVRAAFQDFHLNRLNAFAHVENAVSIHVLKKVGFLAGRQVTVMGMNSILFSLVAQNILPNSSSRTGF
jgi:[ribosomal protein S5]-alanine N-acetyltransferase